MTSARALPLMMGLLLLPLGCEQRMTREQIAEAQRLSREWIEAHPQDGGN